VPHFYNLLHFLTWITANILPRPEKLPSLVNYSCKKARRVKVFYQLFAGQLRHRRLPLPRDSVSLSVFLLLEELPTSPRRQLRRDRSARRNGLRAGQDGALLRLRRSAVDPHEARQVDPQDDQQVSRCRRCGRGRAAAVRRPVQSCHHPDLVFRRLLLVKTNSSEKKNVLRTT
jgi:hypothetical protein